MHVYSHQREECYETAEIKMTPTVASKCTHGMMNNSSRVSEWQVKNNVSNEQNTINKNNISSGIMVQNLMKLFTVKANI